MGSDPLKGKVFIMAWVGEGRPKFFLDTFLKSPNMPAKFGNFLKKKFFSLKFHLLPPMVFGQKTHFDFFLEST